MKRTTFYIALSAALVGFAACGGPPVGPDEEGGEITLVVTSPVAGTELLADEVPALVVTGSVATTSPRGVLEVWVNGVRVAVEADGSFATELAPEIGINHVKVEGGDGLGDLVAHELDVLWGPAYLAPIEGTTGFDLAAALELRLGQRFFDGRLPGTELDLGPNPVVARDLASALELILWHVNLAGLIDGRIQFGQPGAMLDVTIPAATPANVIVDARILDTPVPAIDLHIDLLGVYLAMNGRFVFSSQQRTIAGGIAADMHAAARLTLARTAAGTVRVEISSVTASVGPLVPMFTGADGPELNALIALGSSDFRTVVENLVVSELVPTFTDRVPPLLETLLGATNELLDDVEFTLDTGLGTPVTLRLGGEIGGLDVVAGPAIGSAPGHVTVRQDMTIRTNNMPIHTASRGALRVEAEPARPSGSGTGLHLAMRQDLLNTLLHALWSSGLLEGEIAVFGDVKAQVSARLPPVVRPTPLALACDIDGVRCDLLLQLGQVEVAIPEFEQSFVVSASAGARIVVNGSTVSIAIQEQPTVRVWETSTERGLLTPVAVQDLVKNVVWPELFGAIGDNLSIALPLPDLAQLGLGDLAPGLSSSVLELVAHQRPTATTGYLGLGANVELAAPQP